MKGICQSCQAAIEFHPSDVGLSTKCPICHELTILQKRQNRVGKFFADHIGIAMAVLVALLLAALLQAASVSLGVSEAKKPPIKASIRLLADDGVMIFNKNTNTWRNFNVIINERFHFNYGTLEPEDLAGIEYDKFTDGDGNRFNRFSQAPRTFFVVADGMAGSVYTVKDSTFNGK